LLYSGAFWTSEVREFIKPENYKFGEFRENFKAGV
jgi:hypothetical protein